MNVVRISITNDTMLGDASTTRGDFQFGDNYHFNETLFEQVCYSFPRRFL